ncbi:MAG: phosphopentomutase [Bacillota bacterium]
MIKRVILIILDGVGIGALPDASAYGDERSNTIGNTAAAENLDVPWFQKMGLGNIASIRGVAPCRFPLGAFGKMAERSPGKDTVTGHWEISGLPLTKPFPTYPHGFPLEVVRLLKTAFGREILGNTAASGTEIIERLGREHMDTGSPIVYTSADSVLQIAAHEEIVPLALLYEWCEKARGIMQGEHTVGRIIARPFFGKPGGFIRTENRRDYSLPPTGPTILDGLSGRGLEVYGIGKIEDIFSRRGLTRINHTRGSGESLSATSAALDFTGRGLVFTNCVDFDMLYGHRNDVKGMALALQEADDQISGIAARLGDGDLLCITADHGCDPTTAGTDHSREYVPLLIWGPGIKPGIDLGVRDTFADLGASIFQLLTGEKWPLGRSFAGEIYT